MRVPGGVLRIVELVRESPTGLTAGEVAAAVQRSHPGAIEELVVKRLRQAVAAGLLREATGRFFAVPAESQAAGPQRTQRVGGLRAVAIDVESVVRTKGEDPFLERQVYQLGAVRFGTDPEWIARCPRREWLLRLTWGEETLVDAGVRRRVRDEGLAPRQVWEEFARYLADADTVVAYNGTVLDFPVVREAASAVELGDPLAGAHLVDGLYLAHAVWPAEQSHRLHRLAEAVGVERSGLREHAAGDDATLLVRLVERVVQEVTRWDPELAALVRDVCADSPAWRMVYQLASSAGARGEFSGAWDQRRVAELLGRELAGHPHRRGTSGRRRGRARFTVDGSLRDADGRVDPAALAGEVHGEKAEPRPAQRDMATTLQSWIDRGVPGLLEAPTGTGKSYAVLAVALDWLAAGPGRTAVIATHTKQLQGQLARDLTRLGHVCPGLVDIADLVKGRAGRLSLAELTAQLAEAARTPQAGTTPPTGRGASPASQGRAGRRGRDRRRLVERTGFRELATYLLLRLRACPEPPSSWAARSVDPTDIPAFFDDYLGPVLPLCLEALSQRNDDYQPGADSPLVAHTDTVREAIGNHRLVIANHALALTHLDDLRALGPDTLLIIDEAHELENAATSALSVTTDYRDLENLLLDCRAWVADAPNGALRDRVVRALDELERLFDSEQLPRLAAQAFDARAKGVGVRVGSRAAVLASPYSGTSGTRHTRQIQRLLVRVRQGVHAVGAALGRYLVANTEDLDGHARQRAARLASRADDATGALDRITADIDHLLTPGLALDGRGKPGTATGEENPAPGGEEAGVVPSRVVYLEELAEPEPGLRAYQFRVTTSPVELPADAVWRRFLGSFQRAYYLSATLRTAGTWAFVTERLGLANTLPTLALPSPFDLSSQAELVCFSDFPSWAEQEEGAMRTVAHQLAGYAAELMRERQDGRGHDGGGMVLTTARATAGGIGDLLVRELRSRESSVPVVPALVLGNGRAVAQFTDEDQGGGFLVGTRGLWQGVDVADERRLRLVWINKLPFAPFADPVVEARRAAVRARAEEAGHQDPDMVATERYYLPLAALHLRQAVGRLIRSRRHRGVIVISDRNLGGHTGLRRAYRKAFLGSLDPQLLRDDPVTGERGGGNVTTMVDGWRRIWRFLAGGRLLGETRAAELCTDDALERHTLLPHTRRLRGLTLTVGEMARLRTQGRLEEEVLARAAVAAGLLRLSDEPVTLKPAQRAVISAVAEGRNVLGLLPTGFGKSYTFQLPALVLPGITLVISPLVALMHDQALELNRSIGGAVRALISPLRESSSRAGKTEVADELQGRADHGIRLVYVSPERLCQRRFRELVREAVAAGRLTRIVVDEAHTMAQWEDFRPGMRRVERFIAELRDTYGLPVTAVTATANRSVHAALREGVFGLPPEPPADGSAEERAEASRPDARGGLVTVRGNPVRPELAVFRRSLNRPGPRGVVGLAERVVDALSGHAIFYCLTVKEVNALHAHLREYVGDAGVRVLRFHGRLTEAEKAAVMNEFREAPRQEEEGFAPIVIVATSAFGLGINRPDVRTVFCVSPPTDLAALYQQIGRAGRDASGAALTDERQANVALALATSRGLRTVQFMTGRDLPASLLRRMGQTVLSSRDTMDAAALANALLSEDVATGLLNEREADNEYTVDRYRTGVMRAFGTLADLGAVTDLGDYPPLCAVGPGDLHPSGGPVPGEPTGAMERTVVDAVLALPDRGRLRVHTVDSLLVERVPGYREHAEGPAGTWEILADLHDRGLLDVSAAPSCRFVTGLTVHRSRLPEGYLPLMSRRTARADQELALLQDFFTDTTTCAQRKLSSYFGVQTLPDGCCSTALCRCSACWAVPDWPPHERRPAVAAAFESAAPSTAGTTDSALRSRRLDSQTHQLVRLMAKGVHLRILWHALRGDESAYQPARNRHEPLPRPLRDSRHFGGRLDVTTSEVEGSLNRLVQAGLLSSTEDGRWHARNGGGSVSPKQLRD
ncbi:hypothetical protein AQ490_22185 [Wenjunlia vitaminophila]|uniref:DNA 3'-5' helicase n=1 Tax=Wenjunlia vitaminophila TaxID=76728 RepID=A0A0T6LT45_WENVI|nr:DEAD/DEAH box helicase [Wenjunlia vitaminophila]KRV49023.1 hypothetical protein AQ490_22185 [Wenjunlia vitaminophila]